MKGSRIVREVQRGETYFVSGTGAKGGSSGPRTWEDGWSKDLSIGLEFPGVGAVRRRSVDLLKSRRQLVYLLDLNPTTLSWEAVFPLSKW